MARTTKSLAPATLSLPLHLRPVLTIEIRFDAQLTVESSVGLLHTNLVPHANRIVSATTATFHAPSDACLDSLSVEIEPTIASRKRRRSANIAPLTRLTNRSLGYPLKVEVSPREQLLFPVSR